MAPTPPETASKRPAGKDLACVDCQRRKKKCDKKSPCSNCVKHNVECIASSPAPPRKRRQPMKDLLERLAACEERLKHCRCHEVQGNAVNPVQPPNAPPPGDALVKQEDLPHQHHPDYQHQLHHQHQHQHELPPSPPASAASRDAAIANVLDYSDETTPAGAPRHYNHYA